MRPVSEPCQPKSSRVLDLLCWMVSQIHCQLLE